MTYVVTKTDGTTLVEVADNTINTSACSLSLLGRGAVNFGNHVARNFVRLTENFADDTAPSPALEGQLWYDTGATAMKYYDGSTWQVVGTGSGGGGGASTVTIGANTVSVLVANNNIVAAVSHTTIAFGSLPSTATVDGNTLAFASRFPSGLFPGLNLATDGANYLFRGKAVSAQYADVAERYRTSEYVEAGDLVEIGGPDEIRKTREALTTEVFGVISATPAIRMNEYAGTDETHPFVALSGRVPVKVLGSVRKGDRLVASGLAGVAMAASLLPSPYAVFGRALADKTDEGVGLVEVAVGAK